jgi:hypothetical protein
VAFCKKPYLPKATPPVGMKAWDDFVGLVARENNGDLPLLLKKESLFELDIFDSNAAENIINMFENSADIAGGLHGLASMINSGYQNNLFISSRSILTWSI